MWSLFFQSVDGWRDVLTWLRYSHLPPLLSLTHAHPSTRLPDGFVPALLTQATAHLPELTYLLYIVAYIELML
jgi:hypothetical protein